MVFFDANVYAASTFLHGKRVSDHAKDILPLVYDVVVDVHHHFFRVPHQVRNFLDAYLWNTVAQLRAVIVAEDVGSQPVNDREGIRSPGSGTVRNPLSVFGMGFISGALFWKIRAFVIEMVFFIAFERKIEKGGITVCQFNQKNQK